MTTLNIRELNKADVLAALYNRARPQGMGFMHYDPTPMPREEAQACLDASRDLYFDYLKGRVMKVSLKSDELDPRLFDRDNGQGAAQTALEALMRTRDTNAQAIKNGHMHSTIDAAEEAKQAMQQASGLVGTEGGAATFVLGLADVADVLAPAIDRALKR